MPLITPSEIAWKRSQMRSEIETVVALAAALLIIAVGLFLVYRGKARLFDEVSTALSSKQVLNLNEVTRASDLLPYLTTFENQSDREFVARKIYDYISGANERPSQRRTLVNVGTLADVRVDESEID